MIKSFRVENSNPQEFIGKVSQALANRDLGKIVSLSLAGNDFLITFSKLGKSEVTFSLNKDNNGFSCVHKGEKIAFTHKPLRGEIESKLTKFLESLGASVVQG